MGHRNMNENSRLVLTLKYGEPLKVGDAEIIVAENGGRKVKMIISAPRSVKILRYKVIDRDLEIKNASENENEKQAFSPGHDDKSL